MEQGVAVIKTELMKHLDALPADAHILVGLGREELDIAEIVGVSIPADGPTFALALFPADVVDAWRDYRVETEAHVSLVDPRRPG
jgi:hypothetical protein